MKILDFENFSNHNLSEGLLYHSDHNIGLLESVFRIESDSWLDLIKESRQLWINDKLDLSFDDIFLISTDAGYKANYKGKEVCLDIPFEIVEEVSESEYKGRKVNLNKPFRTANAPRKFGVYTKNDSGKVVLVRFGQPGMRVRNDDPKRSKSFRARHNCANPGPKWKPRYWACNVGRYSKLLGLKSSSPW
jgi:hypothetical protein